MRTVIYNLAGRRGESKRSKEINNSEPSNEQADIWKKLKDFAG